MYLIWKTFVYQGRLYKKTKKKKTRKKKQNKTNKNKSKNKNNPPKKQKQKTQIHKRIASNLKIALAAKMYKIGLAFLLHISISVYYLTGDINASAAWCSFNITVKNILKPIYFICFFFPFYQDQKIFAEIALLILNDFLNRQ